MAEIVKVGIFAAVDSCNPHGTDKKQVRYKFDLEDNLGAVHAEFHGPKIVPNDFDVIADMEAVASTMIPTMISREQDGLRSDSRDSSVVLHDAAEDPLIFRWDTWDNHARSFLQHWLSTDDMLDLVFLKADVDLIGNQDLRDLLLLDATQVLVIRDEIDAAVALQDTIDAYTRILDDDGGWAR